MSIHHGPLRLSKLGKKKENTYRRPTGILHVVNSGTRRSQGGRDERGSALIRRLSNLLESGRRKVWSQSRKWPDGRPVDDKSKKKEKDGDRVDGLYSSWGNYKLKVCQKVFGIRTCLASLIAVMPLGQNLLTKGNSIMMGGESVALGEMELGSS